LGSKKTVKINYCISDRSEDHALLVKKNWQIQIDNVAVRQLNIFQITTLQTGDKQGINQQIFEEIDFT